jgi:hypothetical protein
MSARVLSALVAAVLAAPSIVAAAPRAAERAVSTRSEVPGKPTGPIAVEFHLAAQPEVGVPLEIAVTARVDTAVNSLALEANASAPSAVLVTPPSLVVGEDGVYSWRITVVPLAAEAGYLSVIVAGNVDGVAQASTVTVSLRSAAAGPAVQAAGRAKGETLIALPVQESP